MTSDLFELSHNTQTRGNSLKLEKGRCRLDVRKHYFTNRVINLWNDLPDTVIQAKTLNSFKNRLDRFWSDQPVMFDFRAEYVGTGGGGRQRPVKEELNTEAVDESLRSESS